jgi:ankyrin repeat protein
MRTFFLKVEEKFVIAIVLGIALLHAVTLVSACSCTPPPEKYEERRTAILNDPLLDPFLAHRRPLNDQELGFLLGKDATSDLRGANVTWQDLLVAGQTSVASSMMTNLPYSHVELTSHDDLGTRVDLDVELFEESGLCQYTVTTYTHVCCYSGTNMERYLGYFVALSPSEITLYLSQDTGTSPVEYRKRRRTRNAIGGGSPTLPQVFAVSLSTFVRLTQLRQLPVKLTRRVGQDVDVVKRLRVLSDWRTMTFWRSLAKPPPAWFNCTSAKFLANWESRYGDSQYESIYSSSCSTTVTWMSKGITLCPNGLAELLIEEEVSLFCPAIGRDRPKLSLLGTFSVDPDGGVHLSLGGPLPSEMRNGTLSALMAHTSFPHNATTIEECTDERAQRLYDAFDASDNSDGVDADEDGMAEYRRRQAEEELRRREETQRQAQATLEHLLSTKAFSTTGTEVLPVEVAGAFAAVESDDAHALRLALSRHGGDVWIDVERGSIRETLAHVAAAKGSLLALQELIRIQAVNFSRKNLFGETALFLAAEKGHAECVEALLEAMPWSKKDEAPSPILEETGYRWPPAYVAAVINNDTAVLNALLKVATIETLNTVSSRKRTLLYDSAVHGSTAAVGLLLSAGASREALSIKEDSYLETSWGETPVLGALRHGQKETSLLMIRGGDLPERERPGKHQTTHGTVWDSWWHWFVNVFLASPQQQMRPSTTVPPLNLSLHHGVLHEAAAACHVPAVKELLAGLTNESYRDLEKGTYHFRSMRSAPFGDTPLTGVTLCMDLDAALEIARLLLQRGASVQCMADRCPLVEAVVHRQQLLRTHQRCLERQAWDSSAKCPSPDKPDLVNLLLDHHAEVNGVDGLGRSAIALAAASRSQVSLVQKLLSLGADPLVGVVELRQMGRVVSAMHAAAALKEVEVLRLLLDSSKSIAAGADLTLKQSEAQRIEIEPQNWTILHAATMVPECWRLEQRQVESVQEMIALLLERRGSQLNFTAVDEKGNSVLMAALECSNPAMLPVIETLISLGADVNQGNQNGETPILRATSKSFTDRMPVLRLLLQQGANASAPNHEGLFPLHALIEHFWGLSASAMVKLLELLLTAAPQSVHQSAPTGMPPLIMVVLNGNMNNDVKHEAVRTLLSFGASPTKDLWKGETPLQHAIGTNANRRSQRDLVVEDRLIELLRES